MPSLQGRGWPTPEDPGTGNIRLGVTVDVACVTNIALFADHKRGVGIAKKLDAAFR